MTNERAELLLKEGGGAIQLYYVCAVLRERDPLSKGRAAQHFLNPIDSCGGIAAMTSRRSDIEGKHPTDIYLYYIYIHTL